MKDEKPNTEVNPEIEPVSATASPAEQALTALASISYRTGELSTYLQCICQSVLDVLGDGAAAITLYRRGEKKILARMPMTPSVGKIVSVHGALSTYVVENKTSLRVDDALANPQYGNPPKGFCSYLGVPLRAPNGEIVGTLCYFDKQVRQYTDRNEQVATLFADRIATALDNFELYEQSKAHSLELEQIVEQRTKELMDAQQALFQKKKLAAIGEFATLMTHEIRNPLATIRIALEYVEKLDDQRAVKRANLAAREVSRIERMLNEVLIYAKPSDLKLEPVNLSEFMQSFSATHSSMLDVKKQQFRLEAATPYTVDFDKDKLNQICLNLLRNASDAADELGEILCTLGEKEGRIYLQMQNGGALIPEEKLGTITEAFVSGKPDGTGLGLAIVESIVKSHQGQLEIQSCLETGTVITVYFN